MIHINRYFIFALSSVKIFDYKIDLFPNSTSYQNYEIVICTRKTWWLQPLMSSSGWQMLSGQVILPRDPLANMDRSFPEGDSEHDFS